jgi:DNA adenine methylase
METLLKWPGGKRAELPRLLPLVPPDARIIEPFAGGAALFFALEPQVAILNDVSPDLMSFYRGAAGRTDGFDESLFELVETWHRVVAAAMWARPRLLAESAGGPVSDHLLADILAMARQGSADTRYLPDALLPFLRRSIDDKRKRFIDHAARAHVSDEDLSAQLATGIIAGFYTFIRDRFANADDLDRATTFWFLRELCYGGLFRLNGSGRSNVPYGGRSYNGRDLRAKAILVTSRKTRAVLRRTILTQLDFRAFFDAYHSAYRSGIEQDFIFLDPPYDTEFSAYDGHAFGRADHADLAAIVARLRSPMLAVIKRTPFIDDLYASLATTRRGIILATYAHGYAINIRGRNERAVDHLLVTNRPLRSTDGLVVLDPVTMLDASVAA